MGLVSDPNADASLISVFFHVYHRTRHLAINKKLDDNIKPLSVSQRKPQQDQVKSSIDAPILFQIFF